MQDARVISMCVISEYAYADYASQDLLQAGETNTHTHLSTLTPGIYVHICAANLNHHSCQPNPTYMPNLYHLYECMDAYART